LLPYTTLFRSSNGPSDAQACAFVWRVEIFESLPEGRASEIVEVCESDFITVGCFVHLYWNMPPCHTILHPHCAVWSADCQTSLNLPHAVHNCGYIRLDSVNGDGFKVSNVGRFDGQTINKRFTRCKAVKQSRIHFEPVGFNDIRCHDFRVNTAQISVYGINGHRFDIVGKQVRIDDILNHGVFYKYMFGPDNV